MPQFLTHHGGLISSGSDAQSLITDAALQLRLNKVSELIHNSTHHQNVPMARVSVHFVEIIDKVSY